MEKYHKAKNHEWYGYLENGFFIFSQAEHNGEWDRCLEDSIETSPIEFDDIPEICQEELLHAEEGIIHGM